VTRDLSARIRCPTLVLQSPDDHVVKPSNSRLIAGLVASSRVELVWLNNSYHVATIDFDKDVIVNEVHRFIKSIAKI